MAVNDKNLRGVYETLKREGYTPPAYEEFVRDMQDDKNLKGVHETLTNAGYTPPDFDEFKTDMFGKAIRIPSGVKQWRPTGIQQAVEGVADVARDNSWNPDYETKGRLAGRAADVVNHFNSVTERMVGTVRNEGDYYRAGGGLTRSVVTGTPEMNPETGEVEGNYLTPTGKKTANRGLAERETRLFNEYYDNMTVAGQLRRAGRDLEDLHRKRELRARAIHDKWVEDYKKNSAPLATVLASETYRPLIEGDAEYRAYTAAIHKAENRVRTLQHEYDRQHGKDVGFWRGFGETVGDIKTWDFGYNDILDAMTMVDASKPRPKGSERTEGQEEARQVMMEQILEDQAAEAAYGQNESAWYRWGVMGGEVLPFIRDFAMMGGASGGTSAFTRGLDAALLKGLRSAAPKAARNKAVQWTVKALGAMPEDLLYRAPLMANTVQGMGTAADIIDRKLGDVKVLADGTYDFSNDKTWGNAIWQGEANMIIEDYSEMFGPHLEGMISLNTIGRIADTLGAKRLSGILARASSSELAGITGTMQKYFNRLGVSDYIGEVGEEYYGQLWRTMLNLDDAYRQNPDGTRTNLFLDGQFHGDIWGGMALTMGLMGGAKYSLSAAAYGAMKHRVNKSDSRASEIFTPEVWEGWRKLIDGTTNGEIGSLAESITANNTLTPEQKVAAMNYMEATVNLRGFNLGSVARSRGGEQSAEENAANESYMDGYSATGAQEMSDARRMVELHRGRLVGALSEDVIREFDDDPLGALAKVYEPELRRIAADYVNARQVYNGMIQRVRDDIDGEIARSDAEIDGRVNRDTGGIHQAVMRGDGRKVYVVSGSVAMMDDGSGVDAGRSSESVIVRDARTGKVEFVDPSQILSVGEAMDAEAEKVAARDRIRQERARAAADVIDGVVTTEGGESYTVLTPGEDPQEVKLTVLGPALDEDGTPLPDYVEVQYEDGYSGRMRVSDLERGVNEAAEWRVRRFADERENERTEPETAFSETPEDFEPQAALAEDKGVEKTNKSESPEPVGHGIFGDIFDSFKGRVRDAVNFLFSRRSGEAKGVFFRDGLGEIDLVWGNEKAGLYHIIEKHVVEQSDFETADEAVEKISDIINNGEIVEYDDNVLILKDGFRVVLAKTDDGRFILTAYDNNRRAKDKRRSEADATGVRQRIFDGGMAHLVSPGLDSGGKGSESAGNGQIPEARENVTALSRVPVDKKGNPMYEQVPPETAWDALMEETEGDETIAQNVIKRKIAELEEALKKMERQKPKSGLSTRDMIKDEKNRKRAMDEIRRCIDHWRQMSSTVGRRQAEEEARRNEEARRMAEELRRQQEHERVEREEAERVEREALNGVPEWGLDTPQDARARGYRRNGGEKIDRQEPVDAVRGKEIEVKFSESEMPMGTVALIDASSLQPSHRDGMRNPGHFLDEAQPKERTDGASREAARKIALNIRPEEITSSVTAYTGAPTVNSRGETIQGNSRSDALRLMYENYPEQAERYRRYLIDHAADFGLTAEQVEGMEQPVLVNMLDVTDDDTIRLGQYVAQDTESGGTERIKPKNAVKKMGSRMRSFANILLRSSDDDVSFSQLVDANGGEVLRWMRQQGFISDTQYASAFDSTGNLTGEAANDLKGIMYQSIFTGGSTRLEEMFNRLPAKAQRAILATAFRDYDSAAADRMVGEIQQSILAYNEMMQYDTFVKAGNMTDAMAAMEAWKRQYAMDDVTGESYLPSEKYSNFALVLAAIYRGGTQKFIQQTFTDLYDTVQGTAQDTLFDESDKTPKPLADAIRKVLGIEYLPIKKDNNGHYGSDAMDLDSPQGEDGGSGSSGNSEGRGHEQEAGESPDGRGGTAAESGTGGREATPVADNLSQKKEIKFSDPRQMSDAEKEQRGQMLRESEAIKVAPEQIVATKEISARKAAEKWWDENVGAAAFYNTEIGEVEINRNSIESSLAHRYGQMKLDAITSLVEGFENAVYLGTMPDSRERGVVDHYFAYPIIYNGERCYVFCRAMQDANKNRLYVHEVFVANKIKKGDTLQTAASKPHGGIALYRDILANILEVKEENSTLTTSSGKGSDLPGEEQANEGKSSLGERIAQAEEGVDLTPSDKQKEAGNYRKGHVQVGTFDVTIENPKGSIRSGVDADGKPWETTMRHTYGYIRGTKGADDDHIDVFLSSDIDGWNGRKVFVVDQYNPDGTFDEHKVMLGFNDRDEAFSAYLSNYEKDWEKGRRLEVTEVNLEDFEKWIESSRRKTKPFAEYRSVKGVVEKTEPQAVQAEYKGMTSPEDLSPERSAAAEKPARRSAEAEKPELSRTPADISAGVGKIAVEDFGEKLRGARKDMAKDFAATLDNVTEQSLVEMPLSKVFKRPDLKMMVDKGVLTDEQGRLAEAIMQGLIYGRKRPVLTRKQSSRREMAEWAHHAYEGIKMLQAVLSGDEVKLKDAMGAWESRKREAVDAANRHIADLRRWNPDSEFEDVTDLPDQIDVMERVLAGIGYQPGEKVDLPLTIVKMNSTYTGYEVSGPSKHGSLWFDRMYPTLEAAIDAMILAARIKRGDSDVELPMGYYSVSGVGRSKTIPTGTYTVSWIKSRSARIDSRTFKSRTEAEEYAKKVSGKVKEDTRATGEYDSYCVQVKNPLTGERHVVKQGFVTRDEASQYLENGEGLHPAAMELINKENGTKTTQREHFVIACSFNRNTKMTEYHVVDTSKTLLYPIVNTFSTRAEAEKWYKENKERLERERKERNEAAKKVVYFDDNTSPRVGTDYRSGRDATPQMYEEAFGFRGVQFGNWTNDVDRQNALNQAYDAFMDMAKALGLSPRAMSLEGELGLAFGARGGGRFAAHYEPREVVINLTKTKGAGSLAHEWWHAVDNYLARHSDVPLGYATHGHGMSNGDGVHADVKRAINVMMKALHGSEYMNRSEKVGEYWGRPTEVGARLFAEWINYRLGLDNSSNHFLSRGLNPAVVEMYRKQNYARYVANEKRIASRDGREPQIESYEQYSARSESLTGLPYPIAEEVAAFDGIMKGLFEALGAMGVENGRHVGAVNEGIVGEEGILYRPGVREPEGEVDKLNERFNDELEAQIKGTLPDGHVYQMGMPSSILLSTGVPDLPIQMSANRLKAKSSEYGHDFDLAEVRDLVKELQHPMAVFAYGSRDKAQNIIVGIESNGKQFVIGLSLSPTVGGKKLEINSIRNVFPKDNAEWLNWVTQGKLLWVDKEKIQALIDKQRTILADVEYLDLESIAKVVENFENPSISGEKELNRSGNGAVTDAEVSMENDPWSKAWGESLRTKRQEKQFAARLRKQMGARVEALSQELGLNNVEVVDGPQAAHAGDLSARRSAEAEKPARRSAEAEKPARRSAEAEKAADRKAMARGWYDPVTGKIKIVVGNHRSVGDIEATFLHEVVAHHGLRELFGDRFLDFLDAVYEHAEDGVKEAIDALAIKNGWNRRVATEEYLAGLAEDGSFANMNAGWWQKLKQLFMDFLKMCGFSGNITITDNELRYVLWMSWKNLQHPGTFRSLLGIAEKVAMEDELKVGNYAETTAESPEDKRADAAENRGHYNNIDAINDKFNEELQAQIDGKLPANHIYSMGMPGGILLSTGVPNLPIHLSASRLKYKATSARHDFDLSELKDMVKGLQHPIAIFTYGDRSKAQNIIMEISHEGKNFVVGLSMRPTVKGEILEINSVRTVYPKDNHEWIKWITDGKLLYVDKEKIQPILTQQRMTLADVEKIGLDLDSAAKIVKIFENPAIVEDNHAMESELLLFRDGDFTPHDRKEVAKTYERMLSSGSYQFQEALQDSMLGLKALYEAVLGEGFRIEDVPGYENAYINENAMSSANNGQQHYYFVKYMEPLLKRVHELCGSDETERRALTDYMMAKHGLERNAHMRHEAAAAGKETDRDFAGLCELTGEADWRAAEAAAQQMVDDYESDHETAALWEATNRATKASLDKLYASGLMSDETYQRVAGMYDFYIPLRGWDDTTSDEVYGYLTGDHGQVTGMVRAKGRSSKADDPIATIGMMADEAIRQGNRNVMKQRFLNFVLGNPSDLVSVNEVWLKKDDVLGWEPVFADLTEDMTHEEVEKELADFEAKMEALRKAEPKKYRRGRDARNIPYRVRKGNLKEHQVLVKRNGRTYVLTINGNPRAAQALNGLTNPDVEFEGAVGNLLKAVEAGTRVLSSFYTTRNPDFVMRNFVRDMLYSNCMTWVKENPRYALRFHKNFGKVNPIRLYSLLQKWESGSLDEGDYHERMFKEFMLNGGETGYTSVKDIEGHKRTIAAELRKQGSMGRKAWSILGKQLDLLNRSAENCARFAAFLTSREMGRSMDRSIYDAKEISVNFNKKGSGGKFVNAKGQKLLGKVGGYLGATGRSTLCFWNAGVQAMTNFGRTAIRNPKKALAGAAIMYTLGIIVPYLAKLTAQLFGWGDDDNYYDLADYDRRSNICLRVGKKNWIKIPLPIEYRAIYGLGELTMGVASGNERYSTSQLAINIAGQVTQILPVDFLEGSGGLHAFTPSIVKPAVEIRENESWNGLPIYKGETPYNKYDPEWKRVFKSADPHLVSLSRWLNEASGGDDYKKGAIDINPAKIEYLFKSTFGGVIKFPMEMSQTADMAFGDREFDWRSVPILNSFVMSGDERTANRKLRNEYFKYREEADATGHLVRKYEKAGDGGILEYAEKADFMYNSKEHLRYLIYKTYENDIEDLRRSMEDETDPEAKKVIEAAYYATMREAVELMRDTENK